MVKKQAKMPLKGKVPSIGPKQKEFPGPGSRWYGGNSGKIEKHDARYDKAELGIKRAKAKGDYKGADVYRKRKMKAAHKFIKHSQKRAQLRNMARKLPL